MSDPIAHGFPDLLSTQRHPSLKAWVSPNSVGKTAIFCERVFAGLVILGCKVDRKTLAVLSLT